MPDRTVHGGVSFWVATTPRSDYPPLSDDVAVDVAVVGGGIAGITAAVLLKRAGRTVALVEADRIAEGATGYTTAKVTAGHGAIYGDLAKRFGEEGARRYAAANQAAVERVRRFVEEDGIDCDFEPKTNFVYAESESDVDRLRSEVDVEQRVGLSASFTQETPLPFAVTGALRLENQAQFHPRKYLLALARTVPGDGSHLFEQTRALDVRDGDPCVVRTDRGEVRARDVIVATHLPFLDRGFFFTRAYPHRSYAIAAPIDPARAPDGMFINAGTPTRSIRTLRDGERLYLQVGGAGHMSGRERDTSARYEELERFLREHWPEVGPVEYRWSTMDYLPADKVPYVGRLRRGSKHVYAATGFNKWGMTNGTVAAMILADRVLGNENAWASLYESKRLKPLRTGRFLKENSEVGAHYLTDRLRGAEKRSAAELANGEGAIVRVRGRKTAVYRDEGGKLHALSPVCQHLYCIVGWNAAERTWDCPCHGSRYSGDGKVIHGPTVRDLKPRRLPPRLS